MSIISTILDIVFPIHCISCRKEGYDLCLECLADTRVAERESADWIFPVYDYRDPKIKKSIWLLKYSGKKRFAHVFAEVLYDRILEELADLSLLENFREPVLIPIPLSRKRQRERGFNQALLMCEKLLAIDKKNGEGNFTLEKDVLVRQKDGEHQAHIENRTARLKNIIGSFSVEYAERIKNRNIILIDDVTTTGATLSEAKKVLKQAGAKKIIACTVAH